MTEANFDWATDESVILHRQPATAVYRNGFDAIVVRQEGLDVDGSDDPFLTFEARNVPKLCSALLVEAGYAELAQALETTAVTPASAAPLSPAERSRRYRAQVRERDSVTNVTSSVTAAVTSVTNVTRAVAVRDGHRDGGST